MSTITRGTSRASWVWLARFFPPEVVQRIERFVGEEPSGTVVFDPRHLLALQRVLVVHAAPDPKPARGLEAAQVQSVGVALLALASVLPMPDPPAPRDDAPPDWRAWTSFFAQSAAWYHEPHILEAVARTYTAFAEIASAPELSGHPARTEVDERLRSVYGLDLAEQLGAGLACAAISRAVDPDIDLRARPHIEPGFLSKGLLAAKEPEVIALISASREQLRAQLRAAGDTAGHIGWDHSVLERYPFVQLPDGRMRLTSPRALVAWMTRGLHYRLLDAAGTGLAPGPARNARGRFLTFAGALGEDYVRRLASASLRHAVTAGAVRVHGEIEFHVGKDRRDSPDLAIDAGTDLILVEVYSGRMSLAARTGADPSALEAFVDRSTARKLLELADRVRDVLTGDLRYEGMELRNVRRIFPALVLAGDTIAQTSLVWGHVRNTAPRAFVDDRRVQPPVICDLDDLEPLLALAERGHHLPDLLAAFLASEDAEFRLATGWRGSTVSIADPATSPTSTWPHRNAVAAGSSPAVDRDRRLESGASGRRSRSTAGRHYAQAPGRRQLGATPIRCPGRSSPALRSARGKGGMCAHGRLGEPVRGDQLSSLAPVVGDRIPEPRLVELGVVGHDDL